MNAQSHDALQRLLAGNQRFAVMRQQHPRQNTLQRQILTEGQSPFAAVLSCSDSRVPSEIIFDQGLGDLFIVRTAGHVVNDLVLASLEYAVYALSVPLIVVMGHAQCGAVTAAMQPQALPGHLSLLVEHLRPALQTVDPDAADPIDQAVRHNARYAAAQIAADSPVLAEALATDRLGIVAACYDLATSRVRVLS